MSSISAKSQIILIFAVVALLSANVILVVQNLRLRKSVEQAKMLVTEEGYRFSDLTIKGPDGQEETVNLSDGNQRSLLLIFNSSCQYCTQEYPYWQDLLKHVDANRWRVLALTSEEDYNKVKAHLVENGLEEVKIGLVSRDDIRNARMLFTPMTLIVDQNGVVKKVWPGLWKNAFELLD